MASWVICSLARETFSPQRAHRSTEEYLLGRISSRVRAACQGTRGPSTALVWRLTPQDDKGVGAGGLWRKLGLEHALCAAGFGAAVGNAIVLAVEAQDEHGAAVHVATRLVGSDLGSDVAFGVDVADPFAEAAAAEFFGAAEEVDGVVGVVRGDAGFHGAEMFVTERENVRPHA
jgi:hypothetical protein